MKQTIIFFSLIIFIINPKLYGQCTVNIVPASYPGACVAIELVSTESSSAHDWSFTPAVVDVSTGDTVTNVTVAAGAAGPIVYWTGTGDKQICYDGCCQTIHSCDCNPLPSDDFEDAPLVCNSGLFCGTTLGSYTVDQEDLVDPYFGGTLENNSWFQFIADSTDVAFNINVLGGCDIQFAVYEPSTSGGSPSFTLYTQWSFTGAAGFSGNQTIDATGLTPGNQYYIMVDGMDGAVCDYEIQFESGLQSLDLSASSTTVCPGDPTTLTISPNDPAATYTWTDDQGGGPYPNDGSITVNPSVATTYSVEVVGGGCLANESLDVTINIDPSCSPCANPPTLNLTSTTGTICVSDSITISGNTFGGSATSVTITENGAGSVSPVSSGSSPFDFTYTPAAGDIGNDVTITITTDNPLGAPCIEEVATYVLSVVDIIEPTFNPVASICNGEPIADLPTTSINAITGTWLPNIDSTTTTTYIFTPDAGQCADTTSLTIVVNPLPTALDQTPQLCEDAGTPGVVAGMDLTLLNSVIDGGAGSTLTWYNDTLLTSPVATPTNATVTDGQVFFVEVDDGTCITIAKVTYTVTSTITLTDPATVLCEDSFGSNSVANVDLTSYNTSVYTGVTPVYTWYQDAGMIIAVGDPTDTTITGPTMTLYVDVTDGTCNNNTAVTFTVNAQSVGVLDSTVCNGGSVVFNGTTYSAATSLTGTETLIAANNCDSVVTVTVIELPTITGTLDSTICAGESFILNGTTYDAANPTGTETLVAASGCDSVVTVTAIELPAITGTLDSIICAGESFIFNGTTYDAANPTGTETLVAASGCDSVVTVTAIELPAITGTLDSTICAGGSFIFNGTTYSSATSLTGTETLVAASGCDSVVTVTAIELPAITGTLDSTICAGESFIFNGTTYDAANPTGLEIFVAASGCDSVVTVTAIERQSLIAFFTATPSTGIIPLEVTFNEAGSSTGAGVVYTWDYGNGTGAVGNTPTTTFNEIGTYDVELTVSDGNSCGVATYIVTIEVLGESVILIPNVFTPNGDGSNDVFTVTGTNLESVEGEIYNRWGQKMFEWDSVKGYWNGRTLAGKEAPDGTYYYIISAKGTDDTQYLKKGSLSLIR